MSTLILMCIVLLILIQCNNLLRPQPGTRRPGTCHPVRATRYPQWQPGTMFMLVLMLTVLSMLMCRVHTKPGKRHPVCDSRRALPRTRHAVRATRFAPAGTRHLAQATWHVPAGTRYSARATRHAPAGTRHPICATVRTSYCNKFTGTTNITTSCLICPSATNNTKMLPPLLHTCMLNQTKSRLRRPCMAVDPVEAWPPLPR